MWSPTHVQVLVKRARSLNLKGKQGTNDAFVTIGLGKEKFQTSVKEKATENVEWCEQCELSIPSHGNTAEIALTVLHRNFLGVDEFLGYVSIPLKDFDDVSQKPKTKWYPLQCKPGQKKNEFRGELEVRTSFTVKSVTKSSKKDLRASTADLGLSKKDKHKGSLASLKQTGSSFGGSLMSLGGQKKRDLKNLAKSVTTKVDKAMSKNNLNEDELEERKAEKEERKRQKEEEKEEKKREKEEKKREKKEKKKSISGLGSSATLPNKGNVRDFDMDSAYSSGFGSKNSAFQRVGSGRNRDPGVQSDEEDDDFKFDALSVSHRSSGSSLNVGALGVVSKTSTPMSGSLEDQSQVLSPPSDQLYRKSFGTPVNPRKESAPALTPRSSRSYMVESGSLKRRSLDGNAKKEEEEPVLDEWEAKLLGKKGAVPYKSPDSLTILGNNSSYSPAAPDTLSLVSQNSGILAVDSSSSKRSLPEPVAEVVASPRHAIQPQETPTGRKKKIIPVGSDFESSPSPESPRGYVNNYESPLGGGGGSYSRGSSFRGSSRGFDQEDNNNSELAASEEKKKKKGIGLKLKSSYKNLKESGRTGGSLFNLSSVGKGFKDKDDSSSKRLGASTRDLRISSESIGFQQHHSRTHSDGSGVLPPSGQREVPLGREKTPTPGYGNNGQHQSFKEEQQPQRISREVWDRYEDKSREDLIQQILSLQESVEKHAKKQSEMEEYIDGLLMKVMSNAPSLLQKNNMNGGINKKLVKNNLVMKEGAAECKIV